MAPSDIFNVGFKAFPTDTLKRKVSGYWSQVFQSCQKLADNGVLFSVEGHSYIGVSSAALMKMGNLAPPKAWPLFMIKCSSSD